MEFNDPSILTIELKIAHYNRLIAFLITAAIVLAAAVILAMALIQFSISPYLQAALGLSIVLPLLACTFYVSGKKCQLRLLSQIRQEWGVRQLEKAHDFESIRMLFDHEFTISKNPCFIDDQTWKDLNLDDLYILIDRTLTDFGEAVLYKMLREPLFKKEKLLSRGYVSLLLENNRELREKIQLILARLSHRSAHKEIFSLLWMRNYAHSRLQPLLTLMGLAALVSLTVPFIFWSGFLVIVPVGMFLINLLTHYYLKRRKDVENNSFTYLISSIKAAGDLAIIKHPEVTGYTSKLDRLYQTVRAIPRKSGVLFTGNQNLVDPLIGTFMEYINIFFLREVRSFLATADEISRRLPELREMYLIIGELDALQSIASYRASLENYTEPQFAEKGVPLTVKEAREPLLDNPVPASISFNEKVILITGSNMGGKSTFLRNIGHNVLLAQTIATTLTSHYEGNFFHIITSISRTDDLIAGKSFYYVEAERILKALKSFDEETTTLCIFDELLSGTNSTERLKDSESIIRYLNRQNALTLIATHDIELVERLESSCGLYHFTDNVDDTGLKFDYLLKPGRATTQNAIALLKYLGYPKEITDS